MLDRVTVPFTLDQTRSMNAHQDRAVSKLRCAGGDQAWHPRCQTLRARTDGWFCDACRAVVRDWAHPETTDWSWMGDQLTIEDAALILNVSVKYVTHAAQSGLLDVTVRLDLADVLRYQREKDEAGRIAAEELTRMDQELGE